MTEEIAGFRQVERTSLPRTDVIEAADSSLPSFLRRTGWVVEISDVRRQPAKYQDLVFPPSIESMREAWLIVPLLTGEELIGFVVLVNPRIRVEIDWEVLDLLKTAGRQASSYLAYAMAAEALLEANKFDAFNRLSAFVVHDLKELDCSVAVAAQQCRTPPQQSGVPARHDEYGRARRWQNAPTNDAIAP